jgi:hypothetical protein
MVAVLLTAAAGWVIVSDPLAVQPPVVPLASFTIQLYVPAARPTNNTGNL